MFNWDDALGGPAASTASAPSAPDVDVDAIRGEDALPPAISARHRRFRHAGIYDAADWYDVDYAGYLGEWRFYERLLEECVRPGDASRNPGGHGVVEVGAGTGRLTMPLAQRVTHVHAVEPAAAMRGLLLAKIRAAEAQEVVDIRVDVEDALGDTFVGPAVAPRLVIFPFNGILHVHDRAALVRTFIHCRRALDDHEDARFALDMTGPYWETMRRGRVAWGRVDERVHPTSGRRFVTCDRSAYDPKSRQTRIDIRYAYVDDDSEGLETSLVQQMWTYAEILQALETAGLVVADVFGDVDLSPFHEGAPRLLVSARRA